MRMRFRLSRTNYVRASAGGSAVPGCSLAQSQARMPVERNWANYAIGV